MVTILPRVPSTGEKFAKAFANLGQSLGEQIPEHLMGKRERGEQNKFAQSLGIDLSGIQDKEIRKFALQEALKGKFRESPTDKFTTQFNLKNQQEEQEAAATHAAYKKQGLPVPEEHIPGTPKSVYDTIAKRRPTAGEEETEKLAGKRKGFLETIDDLRNNISYTGSRFIPGTKSFAPGIFREAKQKRAEFDVLAFSLEGFLRELSTKGQLPQSIFATLLTKLPSSGVSERENKGRLDAIEKIVKRYLPEGEEKKKSKEEPFKEVILKAPNGKKVRATSKEQLEKFEKAGAKRI